MGDQAFHDVFARMRRDQALADGPVGPARRDQTGLNMPDGPDGPRDTGLDQFIAATRRQNFLVPPRRHRAFPLLELA